MLVWHTPCPVSIPSTMQSRPKQAGWHEPAVLAPVVEEPEPGLAGELACGIKVRAAQAGSEFSPWDPASEGENTQAIVCVPTKRINSVIKEKTETKVMLGYTDSLRPTWTISKKYLIMSYAGFSKIYYLHRLDWEAFSLFMVSAII